MNELFFKSMLNTQLIILVFSCNTKMDMHHCNTEHAPWKQRSILGIPWYLSEYHGIIWYHLCAVELQIANVHLRSYKATVCQSIERTFLSGSCINGICSGESWVSCTACRSIATFAWPTASCFSERKSSRVQRPLQAQRESAPGRTPAER